jgi:hypothetical protein
MNALRSLFDGTKRGKRKQTVYTPQLIIDAVLEVWPHIALDPCSGPRSIVPARRRVARPQDGLAVRWPKYTFVNPPYDQLKAWLAHKPRHRETMLLVPVRSQRPWWRDLVFHAEADERPAVCWLDPVTFRGYDDQFPAPLCVLYSGDRLPAFGRAFAELGSVTFPEALFPLAEAA